MKRKILFVDPSMYKATIAIEYLRDGDHGVRRLCEHRCPLNYNLNNTALWVKHVATTIDAELFIETSGSGSALMKVVDALYEKEPA